MVFASRRICSGDLTTGERTPSTAGRAGRDRERERRYPLLMADRIRVACVQLNASETKADNLEKTDALVARAASTGADVVVLPEKWNAAGSPEILRANAEPLEGGETVDAM